MHRQHHPAPQRRRIRRALAVGAIALLGATAGIGTATTATAAPDFYTPPTELPTERGAVIKTEPMPLFLMTPGTEGWPVRGQRVMFTSRTQDDSPVAVTGTYIDATQPWQGEGERPTVVISPGTVGQGDQCALSRAFSVGMHVSTEPLSLSANQEAQSAAAWNALGARVFVTDYIGLGTPGVHTYANRIEQAHAVLDAARAANRLAGTGPDTPLAIWGYSQGGGASASAAEMQPAYAPELNLKGTWAGAPTADLMAVVEQIDGNLIGAAIGFAINGFVARYPELAAIVDELVSPAGRAVLGAVQNECIADIITKRPFTRTSDLTLDGRPLLDHLRELPAADRILREQRTGSLKPTSPVLITHGVNDDTVPYDQGRQLAHDWCAKGATVTFRTNNLPPIAPGTTFGNHFGPELIDGFGPDNAISYLMDRLAGKPVSGCTFD
ncbi:lipase [Nocardia cyriacigeorgica]|uniref:Lipase n=1 Tax=Nocardia cyriacigeorgica TaxID=135487 RepID=A0A6P1DDC0_9NOCA|nr:lipase family protein [Nocardia cyriacigeorgica]NEW48208.1 lipase [Nocardia cyriacigeorgica]NEW59209.1 lipase [Nocardia cyriacigeorgica]